MVSLGPSDWIRLHFLLTQKIKVAPREDGGYGQLQNLMLRRFAVANRVRVTGFVCIFC